ncbi:MAG: hypothetical protein R3A52_20400 [Polyangiales bacterium]
MSAKIAGTAEEGSRARRALAITGALACGGEGDGGHEREAEAHQRARSS